MPYIERELARGTRLHAITRHFVGAFHAVPGARAFRRHLAENGVRPGAGVNVLRDAIALVQVSDTASIAARSSLVDNACCAKGLVIRAMPTPASAARKRQLPVVRAQRRLDLDIDPRNAGFRNPSSVRWRERRPVALDMRIACSCMAGALLVF